MDELGRAEASLYYQELLQPLKRQKGPKELGPKRESFLPT